MFIRKKKVLKMIDALIEDTEFWKAKWKDDPQRVAAFKAEGDILARLVCWINGYKPHLLMNRSDMHYVIRNDASEPNVPVPTQN